GFVRTYNGAGSQAFKKADSNVVVSCRFNKPNGFARLGPDLFTNVTLSLDEALSGFEKDITSLNGTAVRLVRKESTPDGYEMRLKGLGLPIWTEEGPEHGGDEGSCSEESQEKCEPDGRVPPPSSGDMIVAFSVDLASVKGSSDFLASLLWYRFASFLDSFWL
ncbi:unnamed protein product, partial [Chrysoparadoxa australica]